MGVDATVTEAAYPVEKVIQTESPVHHHRHLPSSAAAFPVGAFATTLTTLSLSLMEFRGVTVTNVYVANFFFLSVFGLLISAQWELSAGNGFAYTVYSAFGLFYAGYGAVLTPAFGVRAAYGDDVAQYNNALGFFFLLWTVFVFAFLVASITSNVVNILVYFTIDLGFLLTTASCFAKADGYASAARALQVAGGASCFVAGLLGWYLTFHLLLKDELVELPLGHTGKYFPKKRAHQG
ncbi:hypothetical protein V2A60_008265 [Cordyceps javanica]|uniref:Acetate transporter n=1 Tax=Cordyceps javanica TaxID=43265 RepID=A0A545VK03_9HYPO|nr:acetate transporter [Cordyceps javanica]TQW02034.1 acetate transporter [Cordyceps javanica]